MQYDLAVSSGGSVTQLRIMTSCSPVIGQDDVMRGWGDIMHVLLPVDLCGFHFT